MRHVFLLFLLTLGIVALSSEAQSSWGQCSGGSCRIVPAPVQVSRIRTCKNKNCKCKDCKCRICRCGKTKVGSKQPGCSCSKCECSKDKKAKGCNCYPCKCNQASGSTRTPAVAAPGPIFGVQADKIHHGEVKLNGRSITRKRAFQELEEANLPSDEQMPYLTIIGTEAQQVQVEADLDKSPELAPFKGHFKLQTYTPQDWAVECGFVTTGAPEIYIQAPDGKDLHRDDLYRGPAALATALRKADPAYKPAADPNLSIPHIDLSNLPTWVYVVAGGLVVFFFLKKDK